MRFVRCSEVLKFRAVHISEVENVWGASAERCRKSFMFGGAKTMQAGACPRSLS